MIQVLYMKQKMKKNTKISYGDWTPHLESSTEQIDLTQVRKLAGVLNIDETAFEPENDLPPMWHWLFFLHRSTTENIGEDGHPKRGGFFPPIKLQRRMFAGERIVFHSPLKIGLPATRTGTIVNLEEKVGSKGPMILLSAHYQIKQDEVLCIEDTHNIVYLDNNDSTPAPGADSYVPPNNKWYKKYKVDPVFLFRYSALSFNSHRIHYDRDYTVNVEKYPGLIVHGPLTALLLSELVRSKTNKPMKSFSFRGQAPIFEPWPFYAVGAPSKNGEINLEAVRNDSVIAMTATAKFD
ncbi:MAG: acyl-CoA dehydrogenase [Alphaproteobacteria bacterium]|nr:acyl-CoA dehydrogenase [Alphaproteobacteria bacterium]